MIRVVRVVKFIHIHDLSTHINPTSVAFLIYSFILFAWLGAAFFLMCSQSELYTVYTHRWAHTCICAGEWSSVILCAYFDFCVLTKANRVLNKRFGGSGNKAAVSRICHRLSSFALPSSASSYTSVSWLWRVQSSLLHYETEKGKTFLSLSLASLWSWVIND